MKAPKFKRCDFEAKLIAKALKDPEFRKRLLSAPKETYQAELGRPIPKEAEIRVVEEKGDLFYVVLPFLPYSERFSEEQIAAVARRELTHREPCWGVGDPVDHS
jgi:hypothetical protein